MPKKEEKKIRFAARSHVVRLAGCRMRKPRGRRLLLDVMIRFLRLWPRSCTGWLGQTPYAAHDARERQPPRHGWNPKRIHPWHHRRDRRGGVKS